MSRASWSIKSTGSSKKLLLIPAGVIEHCTKMCDILKRGICLAEL